MKTLLRCLGVAGCYSQDRLVDRATDKWVDCWLPRRNIDNHLYRVLRKWCTTGHDSPIVCCSRQNWRTIPDLFHHLFPFSLNHLPSRKSARLFFFFFIRVFVVVMSWLPVTTRHQFRTFVQIVSHSFQDRVLVFSSSGGTLMTRVKFLSKESCSQISLQLIFVGKKD